MLFAQLDVNGDRLLSGAEASSALLRSADESGEGRVSLLELARSSGALGGRRTESASESAYLESRVTADGDLARLLDGIDPYEFDRDNDRNLSRSELERAFFAALDLDGDGRLSRDELSRYPRELRQLRYRDELAEALWRQHDTTRDGSLDAREFDLEDEEWLAIDVDRDGLVALPYDMGFWERRLSGGPIAAEWPRRRARVYALPPNLTAESLAAALDADGDGSLTTRELKRRRDLLVPLDFDSSGSLEPDELRLPLAAVSRRGVDAVADDFVARWDLDGDGEVAEGELPLTGGLRRRVVGE
jgi:Ca2+-binding EF-hand superfamily protein